MYHLSVGISEKGLLKIPDCWIDYEKQKILTEKEVVDNYTKKR